MTNSEKALKMHEEWHGKIETCAKSHVNSREDLAIAYTPGVAEPCKVIAKDPEAAYTYTMKSNTVAVVSDGSAVLGLGNIGALAAMPVMEGKAVLFKEFGGVNAVPICLDTQDTEEIIKAVEDAGYGASPLVAANKSAGSMSAKLAAEEEMLADKTTPLLKKRLIASIIFLLALMYFSMGVHMWNWPVPSFMRGNHVAMGLMQLLLSGIIMVINQKFFISGFRSLFHGSPNMDSTIALGSAAAFAYSRVMLFAMTTAQMNG